MIVAIVGSPERKDVLTVERLIRKLCEDCKDITLKIRVTAQKQPETLVDYTVARVGIEAGANVVGCAPGFEGAKGVKEFRKAFRRRDHNLVNGSGVIVAFPSKIKFRAMSTKYGNWNNIKVITVPEE